MRSSAEISLFGHVGQDPKVPLENNPDFVTFSLAVTEKWKDKSGEEQNSTQWYSCVTSQPWLAHLIKSYVKTGVAVWVRGTPKFKTYVDREGNTKFTTEVIVNQINILSSRNEPVNEPPVGMAPFSPTTNADFMDLDDEVPF
jgi:single-strand DNA-binding protein